MQGASLFLKMMSSSIVSMPGASMNARDFYPAIRIGTSCFWAVSSVPVKKQPVACVQKVRYQSLAHAYAVNRPYAETLAYTPWQGIVIDTLFRPLTDHIYAAYPMFAFQNNLPSDNDKFRYLELIRRCCGGLERIQKINEFYHRHTFGIIAAHVLILSVLLWSVLP